ncbi:MAG: helix-turn-helix transcriptional regulator [Bacteroidota bacterium]|jgi:DNA-binding CsgD family transcriptional regulator
MIVIASSSYIVCKGLTDILKELYTGKKIVCVEDAENLIHCISQNRIMLLLVSSEIASKIDPGIFKKIPFIKLIDSRPEFIETDYASSELLFLSDNESNVLRILKRKLALLDKNTPGGKSDSELSERELDIVREVALGKTNKEIADNLFISTHTVITHRKNITRKLGIKTVSGLTVYALLNKLIKMGDSL